MRNQDAPMCNTDKIGSIPESDTGPSVFREKMSILPNDLDSKGHSNSNFKHLQYLLQGRSLVLTIYVAEIWL